MKSQKRKNLSTFLIISVSLVIGFLIGYLTGFRYGIKLSKENYIPYRSQPFPAQVPSLNLSPEALEVVKELNCICGCRMELLPCTCDEPRGSKEIRLFVQGLVDKRLLKPDVIKQVVEKYGSDVLIKRN